MARDTDAARPPSLAIDRVFSIRGRGTVVTGSLRGGPIATGDLLRVVPGSPDARVRVREVQVHNRRVERADAGRVALNLVGPGVETLARGVVLTADPAVVATDRLLVALRPAAPLGRPATGAAAGPAADRTRVTVHLGTAHAIATVGRGGRDAVDLPAGEVSAILRLDRAIAVSAGDRFALRRPSPALVAGGGRVLDPVPARGVARRRTTHGRLVALASAAHGSPAWTAARLDLHGALDRDLAADIAAAVDEAILAVAASADQRRADLAKAGERVLRRQVGGHVAAERPVADRIDLLAADGRLVRDGDRFRLPGSEAVAPSPELIAAMDRLLDLLHVPTPPALSEAAREAGCPAAGLVELERAGRIVRLEDDLAWATDTWRELAGRALAMAAVEPLTPAAFRDATGTSRKYVMAILEDLDRRAVLRRTPAGHVPGQRAASLEAAAPAR